MLLITVMLTVCYQHLQAEYKVEAIKTLAWTVANKVIVIDPGHGGIDPGAVGPGGGLEKDIALAISKRLALTLSQAGAAVIMTRETDQDLSDANTGSLLERKREDLARRVAIANERNADLFISIHVNKFPGSKWRGAQTFYHLESENSRRLAVAIQTELVHNLKNTDRKAKGDAFYIMRNTEMPAVTVEVGFISNPEEEQLLQDPLYQSKVAWAIYAGIVRYYSEEANARTSRSP
ncbi:MAG: N-acetylmuramoyl-L-alanine amidase CwlD [Firmicutes bacterium]|nr:N-acetylmuramoyl-L-alanine amidase CwlD [Bacillota bacterium]